MKTVASAIMLAFFANGQQVPVEPVAQTPVDPAVVVTPVVEPAIPATPIVEPAIPAYVPPPPLVPLDPGSYTCELGACAGRTLNVPASQGWQFKCAGNCRGMTINLEAGYDPLHPGMIVDYIDSITCAEPGSCAGMRINVVNSFCNPEAPPLEQLQIHNTMARKIEINDIRCEAFGACDGMELNAQCGVDIMKTNLDCNQQGNCVGAIVRDMYELKAFDTAQNPGGQLLFPHQVRGLGIPPPPPGCIATNSNPCLPRYGAFKTNAATPNYQNGYMKGPVPQQPVPQQPYYNQYNGYPQQYPPQYQYPPQQYP